MPVVASRGDEIMRKPVFYVLIVVIVLLAVVTAVLFQRYRSASQSYSEMKVQEETARVGYSEAFNAMTEIQDSLNAIAVGDTAVNMMSKGYRSEMKATEGIRRQALDHIALLNASLQRNKDRLRKLEANLRRSGVKMAGLEKMLDGLKQQMVEKEAMIATLNAQVDSLHTTVTGLQTEVAQGVETIHQTQTALEQKRSESATVYYIVGNKSELLKSGVVVAKGGVLGLGKTLLGSGQQNESLFTALDTDHESVVRTPAAKVQVLSNQPVASYELQLVDGKMELHILDPGEFRKAKHLVIMTK
jgi:hypothetical protein